MRKCIFHIAAFSLVVISFLPMAIPGILLLQKSYVRWEMREKLEEEQLQTIRVKASAVQWSFFGNECRIEGKMFDVKKTAQDGDFLILTGLFDDRETEIEKDITRNCEEDEQETVFLFMTLTAVKPQNNYTVITGIINDNPSWWREAGTPALPSSSNAIQTPPPEA